MHALIQPHRSQEYLDRHSILLYLHDVVALLLQERARSSRAVHSCPYYRSFLHLSLG